MIPDPLAGADYRLTGNRRFRVGWFGRRVLQVEETYRVISALIADQTPLSEWERRIRWRDATKLERIGVVGVWVLAPKEG